MVTTRQHKSDKETPIELPASGSLEPEPQRPTKRPKTKPLQEANDEIEASIAANYAKEAEELTQEDEDLANEQAERASSGKIANAEYKPSDKEVEEDDAEEEDAEGEMDVGTVPVEDALQEMGEDEGEVAVGEEEEEEEEEEEPPAASSGKGKAAGKRKAPSPSMGVEVGQVAPDFTLKDQDNHDVSLKAFRGKICALYFYNKDDTSVVSKGGAAFAKLVPEMKKMGAELLFIGPDSVSSHKKFQSKAKLNFPLLSDSKKEVAKTFRCLRGRNVLRCTVLLDPEGKVMKVWKDIAEEEVDVNPQEAMDWLKAHMPATMMQKATTSA